MSPYRIYGKILLLLYLLSGCDKRETYSVQTEKVEVTSPDQIVLLTDSLVKPVIYSSLPGLKRLPVKEAKKRFIAGILPAILVAKHETATKKMKILWLKEDTRWSKEDSTFYLETKEQYKANDLDDLLLRLETMPNSIVLAQAAMESGWGQSRFFLEANNLFGIWSYRESEPRIAAHQKRKDRTIYVKKYEDVSQAVSDYFGSLARARAYEGLRQARAVTMDPFKLLPHLKYYSEGRTAYTNKLKKMIVQNKLTQYDHYRLDPNYLVEE